MRYADPGDCYLLLLDQGIRADDSEYRSLCVALFRSAVADLCCVTLTEIGHRAEILPREPRTRRQRDEREMALAWIRGEDGTASEPLRFVDVCAALDLNPEKTRRRLLSLRPSSPTTLREPAWQAQPVPA